ncbi:MAG TPA: F0F1 ATP synthase subunit B [Candidatus Spyradocola merdavium]|nr:F0F1 ATP synthase subunit B [Candidatus Spyradocola merdavium]
MEGLSAIINPVSLLMHLVNIVILYIVFRLLLYKPVAKFMKSRQERFAKEREELDAEKAEADAIRAQGDEILHKARSDAETQVAQIMAQADKDAKSIREEAQKQAGVIIENAKQEAQEEKRRQLEAMHDQVMELSVALASRILEREIKPEDHQKLMEEFLSEVK